jgi:transcriptional regulator with XRE-family HTH domain
MYIYFFAELFGFRLNYPCFLLPLRKFIGQAALSGILENRNISVTLRVEVMIKTGKGDLSRYVRRVMKQKGLTQRDVELRSEGKITDGYVADILSGDAKNPSVEKLKALARGLGVDLHEIFDIACGASETDVGERRSPTLFDTVSFLEMMLEVAESSELKELVQEVIQLWPEERAVALLMLESLNERKQPSRRGKKSPLGRERT